MFFCDVPHVPPAAKIVHEQTVSPYLTALARHSGVEVAQGIDQLFNALFVDQMLLKPESLTSLGLFESLGLREHNRHLDDLSPAADARDVRLAKTYLARLQAYPKEHLTPSQELSRQVIAWHLQQTVDGEKFMLYGYPINQMWGALQQLSELFMVLQPLDVAEDVDNYLARLGEVDRQMQQVIARMEQQRSKEIVPPRFAIVKALGNLEKFIDKPVEQNPFYARLSGQGQPQEVLARAKEVMETQVYPAYRKMQQYLKHYLQGLTRNEGVWALPDGDAYYAYLLKYHTSLDVTPAEVHALGQKEVARSSNEIAALLKQEGIWDSKRTVGEQLQGLEKRPELHYPNTDAGRAACLKQFEAILKRARAELGPLFSLLPKAALGVRAIPEHMADGAPGAYYLTPSIDGKRSGEFYVNLRNVSDICTMGMETLAIHEGEPGHHFQRSIEMESNLHIMRKLMMNTAYIEGWALYAEKLAYEEGFYSSRLAQIGHLQAELFRAARLVVDTGIHWKRWSREEAIDYMVRTTGLPLSDVEPEIERYFVMPGQACAYKTGQMKILALRQEMKERLGDQFDIRDFHAKILENGVVPLPILSESLK